MKKYAYLIAIVLLSFSCSQKMTPNTSSNEPHKTEQVKQECPKCKGLGTVGTVLAAILVATVIYSFVQK